jgi:hypothetical protein
MDLPLENMIMNQYCSTLSTSGSVIKNFSEDSSQMNYIQNSFRENTAKESLLTNSESANSELSPRKKSWGLNSGYKKVEVFLRTFVLFMVVLILFNNLMYAFIASTLSLSAFFVLRD